LQAAIVQAANGVYPKADSGYCYTMKGYYNNSTKYFFQYGANSNTYNLDASITLITVNGTLVSTETSAVTTTTNTDGSTNYKNRCIITPGTGKKTCSYLITT
jgi:hypothetical protein